MGISINIYMSGGDVLRRNSGTLSLAAIQAPGRTCSNTDRVLPLIAINGPSRNRSTLDGPCAQQPDDKNEHAWRWASLRRHVQNGTDNKDIKDVESASVTSADLRTRPATFSDLLCDGPPITHQLHLRALQHFLYPRCLSAPYTQHPQLSPTPLSCRDPLGTRVLCRRSPTLLSPLRPPIHTYRTCADCASAIRCSLFRSTGALQAWAEHHARLGSG